MERPANVVNADAIEWKKVDRGDRFAWRRKQLARSAGGARLGCSLYEIPPGRRAFPFHYHWANEEAIYVLEGTGLLRLPSGSVPVAAGDYVALPAGEAHGHQMINDSTAPLRYLCFSTMIDPDVAVYPDSGKIGFFCGSAPGAAPLEGAPRGFARLDARVDYWDGES